MRRESLMGSSKYEHDPKGLDRDVNARALFFKNVADPMIKELQSVDQITPEFCVSILTKRSGSFLLTLEGIEAYIWENWERLHREAA